MPPFRVLTPGEAVPPGWLSRGDGLVQQRVEKPLAWGHLHTRNPDTGVKRPAGEVRHSPETPALPLLALQQKHPAAAGRLLELAATLEAQLKSALRLEFLVSEAGLHLVGAARAALSPAARLKVAVALVGEGVLTREEALLGVEPAALDAMLCSSFEPAALRRGHLLASGPPSAGGAVCARAALGAESAWRLIRADQPCILVVPQLTYRERDLLPLVAGVVAEREPLLAARHLGRPTLLARAEGVSDGESVSLDCASGQLLRGSLPLLSGRLSADAVTLLEWADEVRRLDVRANLENPSEAARVHELGASGVGLCRIECLLQDPRRLPALQAVLRGLLEPPAPVTTLEAELADDLTELFAASRGSFMLRLLDAPLSCMLRYWQQDLAALAQELSPMQGLRCGRLSLLHPALLELQVRAALRAWQRTGCQLRLQLMMPGVAFAEELRRVRQTVSRLAQELGVRRPEVGSMLEVPRACLTAGRLAAEADFLSFGTGDLTEATLSMSRYDSPLSFLPEYLEQGLLEHDPYGRIDEEGVGELMRIAMAQARPVNPSLELGTCGAQAVHPRSVELCHRLGLAYVSVPPSKLPGARLSAAQAALR